VYTRGLVAMQLRTAGWAVGRSGEGVKFTGCVRRGERAPNSPFWGGGRGGGSRHKSDRIFIDAKLAISSPVTILNYASASGTVAPKFIHPACFHRGARPARLSSTRRVFSPSRLHLLLRHHHLLLLLLLLLLLAFFPSCFSSVPLSSAIPSEHCTSRLSRRIAIPFRAPYPPHPFSAGNVTYWSSERVEKETIPSNPTNHGERPR